MKNSRISFIIDEKPMFVWNKVPDASYYILEFWCNDVKYWSEKVTAEEVKWEDQPDFCMFSYPEYEKPLNELQTYILKAKSDNGFTAEGDFILLEQSTRSLITNFKSNFDDFVGKKIQEKLDFESSSISLLDSIINAVQILDFSGKPIKWPPGRRCTTLSFSYDNEQ